MKISNDTSTHHGEQSCPIILQFILKYRSYGPDRQMHTNTPKRRGNSVWLTERRLYKNDEMVTQMTSHIGHLKCGTA